MRSGWCRLQVHLSYSYSSRCSSGRERSGRRRLSNRQARAHRLEALPNRDRGASLSGARLDRRTLRLSTLFRDQHETISIDEPTAIRGREFPTGGGAIQLDVEAQESTARQVADVESTSDARIVVPD